MSRAALIFALFFTAAAGSVMAQLPALPTGYNAGNVTLSTVDTTMPSVDGTSLTATTCGEITTHLATLKALDGNLTHNLTVTSSLSCNGRFTLPARTGTNPEGTGWILIESSDIASLPAAGTRIAPATHAGFMPKLLGPSTNVEALDVAPRAHHYRLIGIELGMATNVTNSGPIVRFGAQTSVGGTVSCTGTSCTTTIAHGMITNDWMRITSGGASGTGRQVASGSGTSLTLVSAFAVDPSAAGWARVVANYPHHLICDRCYVHGQPTKIARRGIQIEANSVAVVDSYISEIHDTNSDSQAVAGENFEGPLKILNSYLEASAENFDLGGFGNVATGVSPSDIEIRRNYFFKPLTWRVSDPTYAGINWIVKNSLELKHAKRTIIEGNVFEHSWAGNAQAQRGALITLTPRIDSASPCCTPSPAPIGTPQAVVDDLTIRYNWLISAGQAFQISGRDSAFYAITGPGPSQMNRVRIHDNLAEDISKANWGGAGADGRIFQGIQYGVEDLRIDHNTGFQDGATALFGADPLNTPTYPILVPHVRFIFQDNIFPRGAGGITSSKAEGNATLNYFTPSFVFQTNVIQGANSVNYPTTGSPLFNNYPASLSTVQFVTQSGLFCANCDLDVASPYKTAGTSGSQIGISNWTTFQQNICGAVPGEWSCAGGGLPAPTLASLSVTTGPFTGGTTTILTGTNYIVGTPSTTATFGGVAGDCSVVSTTSIECSTPAHAAGAVNVVVTNPDLQSATLAGYTYTGSGGPTISSLSTAQTGAARGSTFGGYTLTVTGTNFAQGATVLVGATSCGSVVVVSTTTITCIIPTAAAAGAVDVVVTNPDTQSATSAGGFTYVKHVIGRP